jgi:hypothetical protein
MKCVTTCKTNDLANEKRRLLQDRGIEARVAVDPLDARFPALSDFAGVAVLVRDDQATQAARILGEAETKKAS